MKKNNVIRKFTSIGSDNGFVVKTEEGFKGILTKDNIILGLTTYGNKGMVKEVVSEVSLKVEPDNRLPDIFREMIKNKYSTKDEKIFLKL